MQELLSKERVNSHPCAGSFNVSQEFHQLKLRPLNPSYCSECPVLLLWGWEAPGAQDPQAQQVGVSTG